MIIQLYYVSLGDLQSIWSVDHNTNIWVVFDFKADHTITKTRIYGWKSKEMPAECYLQVSNSFEYVYETINVINDVFKMFFVLFKEGHGVVYNRLNVK